MKKNKRIIALVLSLLLLAITACGAGENKVTEEKTYKWDDVEFSVKTIKDSTATGTQDGSGSGKKVSVIIDFGDKDVPQQSFESNVLKGEFTLAGRQPVNYNYHMGNMIFAGTGFEQMITGEAEVFFDMAPDYEINESDLVITE